MTKILYIEDIQDNITLVEKIVTALGKSHCFFADLLDNFPKVDYKTVANAVARLYENEKISQDKDGKFELKVLQI